MEFLIAPIIVALLASALAFAISIIDKHLNNYGDVKININSGKKVLDVKGGDKLLTTLFSERVFIPSACGGKGTCGACKCKITTDVGPILPTERPYLSMEEINENTRLACQIKVKKNLDIFIPEELFNAKEFSGVVEKINDLTYDIKEVIVSIGDESIDFVSGRYVQLVIPPYGKIKEYTQRAYSISSKPSEKNKIAMLIRLIPNGIVTTWVHNYMKVGEKLKLIGPFGEFEKSDCKSTMVCIAGGSGMAPFKSMFHDMLEKDEIDREVWYFFGARTIKDLFLLEEFKEIEKKWPNFHFIPALSASLPNEDWTGEKGLITDVLDKYLKFEIDPSKHREGFLCGSPGMIGACNNILSHNGIKDIFYDDFS
ncbi:2Fe-2S iron-sulfur cluster binding domain-containing protein [Psychrilyobacter sp.]|uniref:NADH:ubiquinone reductase (Na(+)-transporting) subunit F n=1 Tax=Psychrilyobacter sp. TaxID=2586924 RepID=UPI003015C062